MKQKDVATIPLESCQKLLDTMAQAVKSCGAQPDDALDKLSISLASQANAITWGSLGLAVVAVLAGLFGWSSLKEIAVGKAADTVDAKLKTMVDDCGLDDMVKRHAEQAAKCAGDDLYNDLAMTGSANRNATIDGQVND